MLFEHLTSDYPVRLSAKYSRSWRKARKQQCMTCFPLIVLTGAVAGLILISFHWSLAVLMIFGPITAVVFWHRPEYGLYLFFALVIMLTDDAPKGGQGIFAIQDLDVVAGLPPPIVFFLFSMCLIYFFKLYFVEHKNSVITIRPAFVLIVILLIATGTGLWREWSPINIRIDAMHVFFPVLCFYLCVNVLDTRQKIYTMLAIIFLVGVIDASILDTYYLSGHGWPYREEEAGLARIVTQDDTDLMVFVAMIITVYSVSASRMLTGWRRMFALVGCLPMLFAVLFSFRRGTWLGVIAAVIVFYLLSYRFTKRKIVMWVWAGTVILAATLLLALNNMVRLEVAHPFVQRILSITNPKQASNEHHRLEREEVFKEILSSPILGLGLGSVHAPIYSIEWAAEKQPTHIVHNSYLLVWMKLGLPGFLFLLWMLVRYASVLLKYRTSAVSPQAGPIIAGTGSLLGLWCVWMLIGPVMPYWYVTGTIALFAAMTLGLIREDQLKRPNETATVCVSRLALQRQLA
jgi:O-antigen ligase